MKYKVGDEVLVKAKVHFVVNQDTKLPYKVKRMDNTKDDPRTIWVSEKDIQSIPDMTAEEAWEIARRIILTERCGGLSSKEIRHIFGDVDVEDIIKDFSPQQAKAKIEAWEEEKEIKVGDVVDVCGDKGVVTSFGTDGNSIHVLYLDGIVNSYRKDKDIKKTGRHIDIDGLLKQIGGDE